MPSTKMVRPSLKFLACLAAWSALLGLEYWVKMPTSFEWITQSQRMATAEVMSRENQWIICAFFLGYFLAFLWLPILRNRPDGPRARSRELLKPILYTLFVLIAAAHYWRWYDAAIHQTRAIVLISGLLAGQVVRFLLRASKSGRASASAVDVALSSLLVFLVLTCLWQPEHALTFDYRDQARWTGLWKNPNRYGMLMGVGIVVAVSRLIWLFIGESASQTASRPRALLATGYLLAIGTMGYPLYQSFSRGSWLGTFLALACLGILVWKRCASDTERSRGSSEAGKGMTARWIQAAKRWLNFGRRNSAPLLVIVCAVLTIFFWTFKHSEIRPVRRVLSVANMNDFSWRNRVAAYEGALQMMAERPLVGVGWGQSGARYGGLYSQPRIVEPAAIGLNDFFSTGVSFGIPALAILAALIWLSVSGRAAAEALPRGPGARDRLGSRAALVVLLCGFWFDDGLFHLATGALFWILLELSSRVSPDEVKVEAAEGSGSGGAVA
ncbi:MAG: hypothetical protein ACI8V5_003397 [Limisphaerales bacterium]